MSNIFITKRHFLEMILRDFIHRSNKGEETQGKIDGIYMGYKTLLSNQLKMTKGRAKEIEECNAILDKTYKMFSNPEIRKILIDSKAKEADVLEKYGEKILGDNKRTYDMSSMYNKSLIGTINTQSGEKSNMRYISKESNSGPVNREYKFIDNNGNKVSISCIGELHYRTAFGVAKDVCKYRINRQIDDSAFTTDEVFGNISIVDMDNPEYRDAVFSELLGENNMSLSNAGGYIGMISRSNNKLARGEQETVAGIYTYRINDKYCIEYDSEDLSAVMLYQKELQERNKNNKKREEESR